MSGNAAAQLVGGVVGSAFGPFGASIGMAIGGALVPPPPIKGEGPRLTDLTVTASTYGVAIPTVYGASRVGTNLVWSSGLRETQYTESSGGKGGGPTAETTMYAYSASFAVGVCAGPAKVLRIWCDAQLVYEHGALGTLLGDKIRVHSGTEDQAPDSTMQAHLGVDQTPAYRGLCYVVFDDVPLEKFGNRIPSVSVEVSAEAAADSVMPDSSPLQASSAAADIGTANVSTVAYAYPDGALLRCLVRVAHGAKVGAVYPEPASTRLIFERVDADGSALRMADFELPGWYEPQVQAVGAGHYTDLPGVVLGRWRWRAGTIERICEALVHVGLDGTLTSCAAPESWSDLQDGVRARVSCAFAHGRFSAAVQRFVPADYGVWTAAPGESMYRVPNTALTPGALCPSEVAGEFFYLGTLPEVATPSLITLRVGASSTTALRAISLTGEPAVLAVLPTLRGRKVRGLPLIVLYDEGKLLGTSRPHAVFVRTDSGAVVARELLNTGVSYAAGESSTFALSVANGVLVGAAYFSSPESPGTPLTYKQRRFAAGVPATASASPGTLAAVVESICTRAGFSSAELDTSDLAAASVAGYVISTPMSAREALLPLQRAFFFDAVERGGKLQFVKRGKAPQLTLDADALGASASDAGQRISLRRAQDLELPRRVAVSYIDASRSYEVNTQYAARLAEGAAVAEETVELPLVLTSTQAVQIAEILLYDAWRGRESIEIATTAERLTELLSADVVEVREGGDTFTVRITRTDYEAPGIVKIAGVVEGSGAYTSTAVAVDIPLPSPRVVRTPSPSALHVLDLPLLTDTQAEAGVLVAVYPSDPDASWGGAAVALSLDGGATYQTVASAKARATVGVCVGALGAPAAGAGVIDRGTELIVELWPGSAPLVSTTEAQAVGGANSAVVGDEVLTFTTVERLSEYRYRLTGLTRGRRGTEAAMSGHAAGERFVLVDSALVHVPVGIERMGTSVKIRAATYDTLADLAPETTHTYAAAARRPLAPVQLEKTALGGGSYSISWQRRTRKDGEWRDYVDAALGESSEAYLVTLSRSGVAIQSMTQSARSLTLSAQAGDRVAVQQLSEAAGPGFSASITL